jgi:hypothetical protein
MTGRHSSTRTTEILDGEVWPVVAPAAAGCGRFVGRVGALAVALGVGVAVAAGGTGVAWAEDGDGAGGGDTSKSDTSGGGDTDTSNTDDNDDDDDGAGVGVGGADASKTTTTDEDESQSKTPQRVLGPALRRTGVRLPRFTLRANDFTGTAAPRKKTVAATPENGAATGTPVTAGPPASIPSVSDVVTQWTDRLTQAFTGARPATGAGQTPPPASTPAGAPHTATTSGTGPTGGPTVARQQLSGVPSVRSTADQVRGLVATATATVGTDAGRVATALSGAADTLRDQGVDATTALRTQTTTALNTQNTPTTSVAPVAQGPVAQFVSGLLAAIGFTPNSAATTPVRPLAPQTLLGVLALIRREIEHTFFNKAPQFPSDTISLATDEGVSKALTGLPATDADGDGITYTAPARGAAGGPAHGTVTVTKNAAGVSTVTYAPDAGYDGPDTFTLTASDAGTGFHLHGLTSFFNPRGAHTDTVRVNVTVEDGVEANQPPQIIAAPISAADPETGAVRVAIIVTDPDGDDISTPPVVTLPANANGTLSAVTAGGPPAGAPPPAGASRTLWVVTYTPDPQDRLDAFTTPVEDTVDLSITVSDGVNAPVTQTLPVAIDPTAAVVSGTVTATASSDEASLLGANFGADGTVVFTNRTGAGTPGNPYETTVTVLRPGQTTPDTTEFITGIPVGPAVVGADGTVALSTLTISDTNVVETTVTVLRPGQTTPDTATVTGLGEATVGDDGTVALTTILNEVTPSGYVITVTVLRPGQTDPDTTTIVGELAGPTAVVGADGTVALTTLARATVSDPYETTVTVLRPGQTTPDTATVPGIAEDPAVVGANGTVALTTSSSASGISQTTVTVLRPGQTTPDTATITGEQEGPAMVGADGTVALTTHTYSSTTGLTQTTLTVLRPDQITPDTATVTGLPARSALTPGSAAVGPDGTVALATRNPYPNTNGEQETTLTVLRPGQTTPDTTVITGYADEPAVVGTNGTIAIVTRSSTGQNTITVLRPGQTAPSTAAVPGTPARPPVVGADGTVAVTTYFRTGTGGDDLYTVVTVLRPGQTTPDDATINGAAFGPAVVGANGTVALNGYSTDSSGEFRPTVTVLQRGAADPVTLEVPGLPVHTAIHPNGDITVTTVEAGDTTQVYTQTTYTLADPPADGATLV